MLTLIPLFLLSYSVTTQALSATTAKFITGSEPYLTFDNGVTKVTSMNDFLWIKLSDGTTITPAMNTSTALNPIKLPNDGDNFANVGMLVPISTDSIALIDLIGAPNNYWGDDDGDGQGINGITATGNLSVRITDKDNQTVSRNATLDICQAPYKVLLTSTNGSLTTQYGVPNSHSFSGSNATYYISPKAPPTICYIKPSIYPASYFDPGLPNIWKQGKGYLPQTTDSASYSRNFPTTSMNGLSFYLDIAGSNGPLRWPTVTHGGITATMTPNTNGTSVKVDLTGPAATADQLSSNPPIPPVGKPALPQTFELIGYDSSNQPVLKYGFVLQHWFISGHHFRAGERQEYNTALSKCTNIGYRLSSIKDLTNAYDTEGWGFISALPSSSRNHSVHIIGAGFISEWALIDDWHILDIDYLWTVDPWTNEHGEVEHYFVFAIEGAVHQRRGTDNYGPMCTYP